MSKTRRLNQKKSEIGESMNDLISRAERFARVRHEVQSE